MNKLFVRTRKHDILCKTLVFIGGSVFGTMLGNSNTLLTFIAIGTATITFYTIQSIVNKNPKSVYIKK